MKKKFIALSLFSIAVMSIMVFFRLAYYHQIEQSVQQQMRKIVALTPWVRVAYGDLQIQLGGTIILSDFVLSNKKSGRKIVIHKLHISAFDQRHIIPQFVKLRAEGIQISVIAKQSTNKNSIGFTQLGFEHLLLSLDIDYHYDDLLQRLLLKSHIQIKNIADLSITTELANIDYAQLNYYKINRDEILLLNGQFTFYEKGLFRQYIHYQARQLHLSDEQFVQQLQQRVQKQLDQAQEQKHLHRVLYYQAWQRFIKNQVMLKLQFNQPKGLPIKKIKKMMTTKKGVEALFSELNFMIQAQ